MDGITLAKIFQEYGLVGALGVLCAVVAFLFKLLQDSQKAYVELIGKLSTQLQANKEASESLEENQKSFLANLDLRHAAVVELSTQVRIVSEKMTHGFGNIAQSQESFVRLLEYYRQGGGRP